MIASARCRLAACALLATAAVAAVAEEPEQPLRFLRVHVPHGRLADVELGGQRYIPMSAKDFEDGLMRLRGSADAPAAATLFGAIADTARYEARLTSDGGAAGNAAETQVALVGSASWSTPASGAARAMPVGRLHVGRAWMRTAAGTGDALVFGRADGTRAIAIPEPGEYSFEWRCGRADVGDGAIAFRLPLVPALATSIELQLPPGLLPLVEGTAALRVGTTADADVDADATVAWRIDVGPRSAIDITLIPEDGAGPPRGRAWTDALVRGREVRLTTLVAPVEAWRPMVAEAALTLAVPRGLIVTDVRTMDEPAAPAVEWRLEDDGGRLEITVPARCLGTRTGIVVESIAPVPWNTMAELPLLRLVGPAWAGGGLVVRVDPTLVIARLALEECLVVPPEVASRWPISGLERSGDGGGPSVRPTRLHVEHQASNHGVQLLFEPRAPQVVVDRVTVVDVSPGAVLGRTTCDIAVRRGEAFEVRGRLAKGWVLDAVEAIDASGADVEVPDWRVARDADGGDLRIALAAAVSPSRSLTLRLSGHRAGVPPGVDVTSSELDMVRFAGESAAAVLAVKTGPEMTIDLVGDEPTLDAAAAALVDDASIRVRLPAGSQSAERVMRLVRRRPPLDVRTQLRLTSRDGRLTESFTFECSPQRTEVDSLVVHFSAMMDDRLEWSLLPPAAGTVIARRLAPADRREQRVGEPIADTWLVELSPPIRDTVTIRAASTVAFNGPTPIPLAWVEGATRLGGDVSVREAGRFRPRVVNRRLTELPPAPDGGGQPLATVAEFAFDPSRGRADDPLPAAELIPGGDGVGDDARAWVWREESTMWCHPSGLVEYETSFEIENHGRANVTLSVPPGMEMHGVLVDGALVDGDGGGPLTGDAVVALPPGVRFVTLLVRAVAMQTPTLGVWRVDPQGPALDVPVLQRESRILLAADAAIARAWGAYRVVDDGVDSRSGWSQRLLGATLRPAAAAGDMGATAASQPATSLTRFGSVTEGYRMRMLVPVIGRRSGGGLVLVRTTAVLGVATIAAAVAAAMVLLVPASRLWIVPCVAALAAVGALWVTLPFDAVFRAVCWAAVAAGGLRAARFLASRPAAAALAAGLLLAAVARADDEDDLLRVFITPADATAAAGATALVPEPLFRALARAGAEPAAVRIVACDVAAGMPGDGDGGDVAPWTVTVDVDADAGTTLVVDQGESGGRISGTQVRIDGATVPMRVEAAGRTARIPLASAGRQRLEWTVEPATLRRGDVEEFVVAVPCAAAGRLTLTGGADAGTVACEAAPPQGRFQPVAAVGGAAGDAPAFDIAGAALVRACRVVDPRLRLAAAVRSVVSRNDVFWDLDACRLVATFAIESPNEVVRSFTVGVDPGLVLAEEIEGVRAVGPQRFVVERLEPLRGGFSVQIPFRMPLADPTGVFAVPGAWVEDAAVDSRTTQLVPAPDLSVEVTLPDGVTAAPRDAESALQGFAWRSDIMRPLGRTAAAGSATLAAALDAAARRPLVTVERRRGELRAAQQLAVEFDGDQIQLTLQARIDATSAALVDVAVDVPEACVIDRVELMEDRTLAATAADRGPADIRWSRVGPGSLLVVAQRPRSGRYRLEVAARLPGRPPSRGTLPVMRAVLPGAAPLVASWRTQDGRGAALRPTYGEPIDDAAALPPLERATSGFLDLPGGETGIIFELGDIEAPPAAAVPPAAAGTGQVSVGGDPRQARVELADVFLEMDGRGRAWGRVQFDVVAAGETLQLALPAGMRLFEVLVDGRAAAAAPQDDGTWLVPLFDVRWPRSVLAVFAGDVGTPAVDGAPFAIAAPRLVAVPCRTLAWTVRVAPGMVLRVAEPARPVDAQEMAAQRQAVAERLEDEFIRAIEEAAPDERSRMTDFARLRRAGAALPAEEAWSRAMHARADDVVRVVVDEPMDGPLVRGLVVRLGRATDPTTGMRAIATLLILAVAAAVWHTVGHWNDAWRESAARVVPGVAAVAGVVWLAAFEPSWPGWLSLVTGGLLAFARRRRGGADVRTGDSTITQFAPSATASSAAAPSTETFIVNRR